MKKYRSLLSIALTTILLAACSGNSQPGCAIKGNTSFAEYKKAYLLDAKGTALDSIAINGGNFAFNRPDCIDSSYIAVVRLVSETPGDWLEMPVAIEDGTVELEIGKFVHTSGTPLNKSIQEFLNSMQHCKNGLVEKTDVTTEDINKAFSEFYRQQILNHKNNVLGKYILKEYGSNLLPSDHDLVKAQLGN